MAEKKRDASLAGHLVSSRGLIWNLAKNDIKKNLQVLISELSGHLYSL